MKVILFGNRGSRPLGASEDSPWQRYGGDTTTVGVISGKQIIALDTGSAFYKWNWTLKNYLKMEPPYNMAIFYSHLHDDHTNGLPQAAELFVPGNIIDVFGPPEDGQGCSLQDVFQANANEPSNPNLTKAYNARLSFTELGHSPNIDSLLLKSGVKVSWLPVQHGKIKAYGYRIEHENQTLCMISDTHHNVDDNGTPILDQNIVEFINGADALIYDSHFTDQFYAQRTAMCQTFGHSTGEHGVRLAAAAKVPMFVAHHYDPSKRDDTLDTEMASLREYGQKRGISVVAAQPSLCLDFSRNMEDRLALIAKQTTPKLRYQAIAGELAL